MLDMIKPAKPGKISLSDLKKCKMTSIFFDTFFNLEKYLDHEQRDPFASAREHDSDGHEVKEASEIKLNKKLLVVTSTSPIFLIVLFFLFHLQQLSDWDRFAAEEYELLVTEESGNEQNEQM